MPEGGPVHVVPQEEEGDGRIVFMSEYFISNFNVCRRCVVVTGSSCRGLRGS